MINGREYSWENINVVLPGKNQPVDGIKAIEYTVERDHAEVYGRGSEPVAISSGQKKFSGSMELLQSEVEALQETLPPGKDLTDLAPFTVVLSYDPDDGGTVKTDRLEYVRIKSINKGGKSGDKELPSKCDLAIGKIRFNV